MAGQGRKAAARSRIFDAYLMVDWSASSTPKSGKDSIWVAWGIWDGGSSLESIRSENLRTRHDAVEWIHQHLMRWCEQKLRVLVGFDFPFGYPQGFAAALGCPEGTALWRYTWDHWGSRVEDRPDNGNNRFEVATQSNRILSGADLTTTTQPSRWDLMGLAEPAAMTGRSLLRP